MVQKRREGDGGVYKEGVKESKGRRKGNKGVSTSFLLEVKGIVQLKLVSSKKKTLSLFYTFWYLISIQISSIVILGKNQFKSLILNLK